MTQKWNGVWKRSTPWCRLSFIAHARASQCNSRYSYCLVKEGGCGISAAQFLDHCIVHCCLRREDVNEKHLQILHQKDEGTIRSQDQACLGLLHVKALQVDVCQGDMKGAEDRNCMIGHSMSADASPLTEEFPRCAALQ